MSGFENARFHALLCVCDFVCVRTCVCVSTQTSVHLLHICVCGDSVFIEIACLDSIVSVCG